ncbi:zf-HC2 domain-containing protein [Paeniglutamicibacter sp. Y32M11]|nr:zf-HC2 domain-containing protein [Paeniglutamicibacter sp. Y32M11]
MHRYVAWMGEYVDGRLGRLRTRSLERHVLRCEPCGKELEVTRNRSMNGSRNSEQPPLSAQTLLGTHYAMPVENGSDKSRYHAIVPTTVLLLTFALLGTIAGLSWLLGAPAARLAPTSDPAESWSVSERSLDTQSLSALRQAGWTCPVIDATGFGLTSATGALKNGQATVTLLLGDGQDTVEISEIRSVTEQPKTVIPTAKAAKASLDPTSGMLTELGHRLGGKAGAAVTYDDGTATLQLEDVKYRITTSLTKADMEKILQRLVVGEHTRVMSLDSSSEDYSQRLLRGFSRLMVLDFQ